MIQLNMNAIIFLLVAVVILVPLAFIAAKLYFEALNRFPDFVEDMSERFWMLPVLVRIAIFVVAVLTVLFCADIM